MSILVSSIILIILFLCGILTVLIVFLKKDENELKDEKPLVSILIAARNEENNIVDCLLGIEKLTYQNIEVWIGDDKSTDETQKLVEDFIRHKPNFNLLNIESEMGSAKGKSNVLAQLAHQAKGDYFFITDADITVPQNWIQNMLASFKKETGIVSGFTISTGASLFAKLQRIDWAYAMGMVKVVSDFGKPIVGIGNNMAVSREAYFSTGGYEKLDFSIVEDYQLFKEITKNGYGFANLLNKDVCAKSKPITSFVELLQQRKRWMFGAFQLPIPILLILILQAVYYSLAIILCFLKPQVGLNLIVFKTFVQAVFIKAIFNKIGEKVSFLLLITFEFYQIILSSTSLLYYFIAPNVIWKGRKY